MMDADDRFAGDNPFELTKRWIAEATATEPNDPNAIALATVDDSGMPNVRMVLLKDIDDGSFVFYTNYTSVKAQEALGAGAVAFVLHHKTLGRQIRVRGHVVKEDGAQADAYYQSRSSLSRLGAWASDQSKPLDTRQTLMDRVDAVRAEKGETPDRPPFWGGIRVTPTEMEFWADGTARLHDRFRWTRADSHSPWTVQRLYP